MKHKSIVKATREGRLYKTAKDFLEQKKIQNTIFQLLESNLIREIENKNK